MYAKNISYIRRNVRNHAYTHTVSHMRAEDRRSEIRILNNRIRRQQELKKHFLLLLITLCLIVMFSFTLSAFRSDAKADSESAFKYYRSIVVSGSDTLWSIAGEYMDKDHYDTIDAYIREVRSINSLSGDSIRYGDYLVIPYYDSSFVR